MASLPMTLAPAELLIKSPANDAPSLKATPKSQRTRTRILDCAMRLFADIGYANATNARIAEEAGLTRGAMLYHFPSREALVEAAAVHIHATRVALLAKAAGQGAGERRPGRKRH